MRKDTDGNAILATFSDLVSGGQSYTFAIDGTYAGFVAGSSLTHVILCTTMTVGEDGKTVLTVVNRARKILYQTQKLNGLCNY